MTKKRFFAIGLTFASLFFIDSLVIAEAHTPITIPVKLITETGEGATIGDLEVSDSDKGLLIKVELSKLAPGEHGFHLHENGSCAPGEKDGKMAAGIAAGGHYDPDKVNEHRGPHGSGHKGDIPKLVATENETVSTTVTAPRLKLTDIHGRSFIIHAGGDNYADTPAPLGGGAARIACAVVP